MISFSYWLVLYCVCVFQICFQSVWYLIRLKWKLSVPTSICIIGLFQTLLVTLYSTTAPVNIVGEGEGDGEHLVQGDQGDRQDGRAAGHPEHQADTAMTRSSLKISIFHKSSKLLTCSLVTHGPRTPLTPGLGLGIDHQSLRYYCQAQGQLFTSLVKFINPSRDPVFARPTPNHLITFKKEY